MSSETLINIPNRRILDKHFVAQIVGEQVKEYAISAGSKPGDNIMGTLLCVDVKTVTNEIHNLVIKSVLPMTGVIDKSALSNAKLIAALDAFPTEIVYYKQIRPIFQQVLKTNSKRLSLFLHPKHYSCLHDKENQGLSDYLALEDLRPNGYKMIDKFRGLNYEEMIASLQQLAVLHATSYSVLNGQGQFSDELNAIRKDPSSMVNNHGWEKHKIPGCDQEAFFNDVVSKMVELVKEDGQLEMAEKIQNISKDGHKRILMDLSNRTTAEGKYFRVFIHGDLWTNNILIKHGPDGKSVQDVKFIDFQMNRFGNIYEDLHYFIFTSTTAEFRKAHLKSCLQVYFQEFEMIIRELDCTLPNGFSERELISTFHETLDYGFVYNILAIPFQLGLPEPPPSPMTPIEVNFNPKEENTSQFFSTMTSSATKSGSTTEEKSANDLEPDFQEMMNAAVVGLQFSARNSPIALKRLHEMNAEMMDYGLIH